MKIFCNWTIVADALHNLSEDSGASLDYARGVIIATCSFMIGMGMDQKSAWRQMIPLLPNKLRVLAIPSIWLNNVEDGWLIAWHNIAKFNTLLEAIPEYMRGKRSDGDGSWTCRDKLLDSYLSVCAIFQRERERVFHEWYSNAEEGPEPHLRYFLSPIRQQGSQYISEWSVSDMRKPSKESYNWHGQNTSQWLYAGAILVQEGRVSIHT